MPSSSPFGKESRIKILKQHLAEEGAVTAPSAWKFVYRELLWIDGSTGLAHLYESDKAQQGRTPWYGRTVVFTDMLCEQFGVSREDLRRHIDRLFRAILERLVEKGGGAPDDEALVEALAVPEATLEFPEETVGAAVEIAQQQATEAFVPDVDLVGEFAERLTRWGMKQDQADVLARTLVARARLYFTVERKRQNVLGEGFEDLLQLLMARVGRVPEGQIKLRQRANLLPGFAGKTTRERVEAPDIALVRNGRTELLASVKWSLRQDRQKQLSDELDCYLDLRTQNTFPQYILITNEYDPGRLINTDGLNRRGQRIDRIYHINLELLLGALHNHQRVKDLKPLIDAGRLRSLEDFLNDMSGQYSNISSLA